MRFSERLLSSWTIFLSLLSDDILFFLVNRLFNALQFSQVSSCNTGALACNKLVCTALAGGLSCPTNSCVAIPTSRGRTLTRLEFIISFCSVGIRDVIRKHYRFTW